MAIWSTRMRCFCVRPLRSYNIPTNVFCSATDLHEGLDKRITLISRIRLRIPTINMQNSLHHFSDGNCKAFKCINQPTGAIFITRTSATSVDCCRARQTNNNVGTECCDRRKCTNVKLHPRIIEENKNSHIATTRFASNSTANACTAASWRRSSARFTSRRYATESCAWRSQSLGPLKSGEQWTNAAGRTATRNAHQARTHAPQSS